MNYSSRLDKLRKSLSDQKIQFSLISNSINVQYLCGYKTDKSSEREVFLVLSKDKSILVTPRMFESKKTSVDSSTQVEFTSDGNRLTDIVKREIPLDTKLGFEESNLTVSEYKALNNKFEGVTLEKDISKMIRQIRDIKDDFEINEIKKAQNLTKQAFRYLEDFIKIHNDQSDLTELEAERELRDFAVRNDAELGFDPIIAFGPNSAAPHHKNSNTKLGTNTNILFDIGLKLESGYSGDFSTNLFIGEKSQKYSKIYNLVEECQKICIRMVKPGINFADIQKVAEDFFEEYGYKDNFTHTIGHGLGLEIHENPKSFGENTQLKSGMVITIEPGLYFPGEFGVRIEDVVLVGEGSGQVLRK